jgi:sodium/proline symporter
MVTGAAMVLIWHNLIKPLGGVFGIYELLPAFLCGCIAIVIVSLITPEPSAEVLHEFDTYNTIDLENDQRNLEEVIDAAEAGIN